MMTMPSPWANRDPGFYGAPVIKTVLLFSGTASLCQALSIVRQAYPPFLLVLRVWSLPSFGKWLVAALVLYQCRVIEWRHGSFKTASNLILSTLVSSAIYSALLLSSDLIHSYTGWSVGVAPGLMLYFLMGSLLAFHLTFVKASRSSLAGLPVSSNIPLYLLAGWSSSSSLSTGIATATGLLGGLLVYLSGVTLPKPPSWLTSALHTLMSHESPPKLFSGASLQVQSQQRTDALERLMISMQNRQQRRIVIGRPVLQPPQEPPEHLVQQLVGMGFSPQDSSQALRRTGGNVEAALALLTSQGQVS